MVDEDIAEARKLIRDLHLYPAQDPDAVPVARLGGLTNRVYKIGENGNAFALRLPGKGTEEYINREVESVAAHETALADVSPQLIYFDDQTGTMVTRYVADAVTMSPQRFAEIPGAAARAGTAFRKLHDSGIIFETRFELFSMIDSYLALLATKSVHFPEGYHQGLEEASSVRAALAADPVPLAPCHCDPLAENFLDTGKRMWIIDWEFSGMNDPMWDLGDLSVEASFSPKEDEALLDAYFGGPPSDFDRARMVVYKAMSDLLWTLWGLIQLANDNPADDFRAYADNRFRRCMALMNSPEFPGYLKAVRSGPPASH